MYPGLLLYPILYLYINTPPLPHWRLLFIIQCSCMIVVLPSPSTLPFFTLQKIILSYSPSKCSTCDLDIWGFVFSVMTWNGFITDGLFCQIGMEFKSKCLMSLHYLPLSNLRFFFFCWNETNGAKRLRRESSFYWITSKTKWNQIHAKIYSGTIITVGWHLALAHYLISSEQQTTCHCRQRFLSAMAK